MINFWKKPIFIIPIVLILIIAGYIVIKGQQAPKQNLYIVKRGDISQEVDVTGNIKSAENVDLAFEKSGRVIRVNVKVGDSVTANQILASLDNTEVSSDLVQAKAKLDNAKAQLDQYQAALETQQAKLDELNHGTRPEEIQIAQTKVDNAQNALADAEKNLTNIKSKAEVDLANLYDGIKNIIDKAFVNADDAVNVKADSMFIGGSGTNPRLTFSTDIQIKGDAETQRVKANNELNQLKNEAANLTTDHSGLDQALTKSYSRLTIIRSLLSILVGAVNNSTGLSQTTITTYLDYLTTARTNINTSLKEIETRKEDISTQVVTNQKNINTAEASVNDDRSTLTSAQNDLTLKKAGATADQIAAQKAQVKQAQANVNSQLATIRQYEANIQSAQVQLTKTNVFAPFNGIITKQDAKIGEIVTANSPLISLISEGQFEIKADIPEADIAKLKIGNTGQVTLDAYGDNVIFNVQITAIDPAETIIGGVPTYKTTFQFTQKDDRLKSGMTANITILANKHENVLIIPQRTISIKNGRTTVSIYSKNKKPEERMLEIGLRGSNGYTEIISGLQENDRVIIRQEK